MPTGAGRELLEPVDLTRTVITADAAHAQHETAAYIAGPAAEGGRESDYLLAVKGNQPSLQRAIYDMIQATGKTAPDYVRSPTFGSWEAVVLDDVNRHAVYLSEGLGHAYVSLSPGSTLIYICSQPFSSDREHRINPFDPAIGIDWPSSDLGGKPLTLSASPGDAGAPTLAEVIAAGQLPVAAQGCNVHFRRD